MSTAPRDLLAGERGPELTEPQVQEIERFRPIFQSGPDEARNMEPHPVGGFVPFSDHHSIVTKKDERIAELEKQVAALDEARFEAEQDEEKQQLRAIAAEQQLAGQEEALKEIASYNAAELREWKEENAADMVDIATRALATTQKATEGETANGDDD